MIYDKGNICKIQIHLPDGDDTGKTNIELIKRNSCFFTSSDYHIELHPRQPRW